jgi:hypothetical protein
MNELEQFKELLKLQQEIDELVERYVEMVKVIDRKEYPIVELEGEIYQLRKVDYIRQVLPLARKYGGFFHDYRLVKLGKAIK